MPKTAARSFVLLAGLVLAGCAAPASALYTPSALVTGSGDIRVEKFHYTASDRGQVEPNQIKNTALGSVRISDKHRRVLLERLAVRAEVYRIGQGPLVLTGNIDEFMADDLGYSIDWKLRVTDLRRAADGVVYEKPITVAHKADKFVQPMNGMNKTIKMSFEALMKDPVLISHIQQQSAVSK